MRGRHPLAYTLTTADRRHLEQVAGAGQVPQRVAKRAQALLALDRGERILEIGHWTGLRRTSLWRLWQRYQPGSAQVRWFRERAGGTGGRMRKVMIVALARRLLIALWRFATQGVLPEGAVMKPST